MPNPNIPQGTLNRLRGSIVIPDFPALNVTASYLGKEGISLAFEGEATTTIPTMTGGVQSPEPYQQVRVTVHLLKTQALANAWEAQRLASSLIGDLVVSTDSAVLQKYPCTNCAIGNVEEIRISGDTAEWVLVITGFYLINNTLWN